MNNVYLMDIRRVKAILKIVIINLEFIKLDLRVQPITYFIIVFLFSPIPLNVNEVSLEVLCNWVEDRIVLAGRKENYSFVLGIISEISIRISLLIYFLALLCF